MITLQPITDANRDECLALSVAPEQSSLIATTSRSLEQADAHADWEPLGIYRAGTMVGFALCEPRENHVFCLHRMMIDAAQQRQGIGLRAMQLLLDQFISRGAKAVLLSFRPENDAARRLYDQLGFVFHEEEPDGEIVYRFDVEMSFRRDATGVNWAQLKEALSADRFDNGRCPQQLQRSFENSSGRVFAFAREAVVGTARAISDGVCNACIVDVWTRSDFRRRGIATRMVQMLLDDLRGQHVSLFSDDATEFYEKLGFREEPVGMTKVVGTWLDSAQ